MPDINVIQNPPDDKVDEFFDALWAVIEARRRREHDRHDRQYERGEVHRAALRRRDLASIAHLPPYPSRISRTERVASVQKNTRVPIAPDDTLTMTTRRRRTPQARYHWAHSSL